MAARSRRARVPSVLQMEAVECGAACLAMILAHYGRYVQLEELRIACGVSRNGSKASNILSAARKHGMTVSGYKKEPADVAALPMPVIAHWNFNHFVVIEGVGHRGVYLNDPASGPRRVPHKDFDEAFTGVVMTFAPGPGFEKGGTRRSLMLAKRLTGCAAAIVFVLLAGLLLVVPGMLTPTFTRIFVDDVLVKGMDRWVPLLLAGMAISITVSAMLLWLQQTYLLRLEAKLALSSASAFFWHVLRLPIRFFTQRYAGELGSRVAINDRVAQIFSGELAGVVLSALMVIFYAVLMFKYTVTLTLVAIGTMALKLIALKSVSRMRTDLHRRLQRDQGKLMGAAMGGLQSIETLKATGSESTFFSRFSGMQAGVFEAQQQLKVTTELLGVIPPVLMAVSTALILGIGGVQVMDGQMTMGMLVAFQALMGGFIAPVSSLFDVTNTVQEARSHVERLDDVLGAQTDPQADDVPVAQPEHEALTKLTGRVELCNVSFGYSPLERPLIENFSLTLQPGSRVALVGGSGSGKSTIARLVCGLYAPTSGSILFDGIPRQNLPRRLLTASFAMVDQDIFLFEGTVKDNLTMWDNTVAEADVVQASIDAALHDEVMRRPGGYNSAIAEGGRNLSGGQRQRMEIARALVGNPSILVLDEATSALDATTEKIVDDNLRRRGCTCLIIAHRLSTIRDCDEIIVLDRGTVAQRGSHDELKNLPGPYSKLIADE